MLEVSRSLEVAATPDEVWDLAGEFGKIADWHPALAASSSETVNNEVRRTLTVGDGQRIVERLVGESGTSYSYQLIEGPLPVADYDSTFKVEESANGSVITWSSTFRADGADDARAKELIAGIYDIGLNALKSKFG